MSYHFGIFDILLQQVKIIFSGFHFRKLYRKLIKSGVNIHYIYMHNNHTMKKLLIILLFSLHGIFIMSGMGQTSSALPDTSMIAGKSTVLSIAERFHKRLLPKISLKDKRMFEDTSSRVLTNLAAASMIQSMKGELPGALVSCAVIRNPEDANAVNSFGGYLRAIDSTKTSLPVLQYAYKLAPGNPSIISQLGHTYLDLGNVSKAEALYNKALGLDNDNPFALQGMVALYLKKGDKGKALEYMLRSSNFIFSVRTPLVYEQFRDYIDTKTSVEEGEGDREFAESLLKGTKTESIRVLTPQIPKIPPFPFFDNLTSYEKSSVQADLMQLLGEITAKEQSLMAEMSSLNMSDSHEPAIPPGAIAISHEQGLFMFDQIIDLTDKISIIDTDRQYKENLGYMEEFNRIMLSYGRKLGDLEKKAADCQTEACAMKYRIEICKLKQETYQTVNTLFMKWYHSIVDFNTRNQKTINDIYGFSQPWMDRTFSENEYVLMEYRRLLSSYSIIRSSINASLANYVHFDVNDECLSMNIEEMKEQLRQMELEEVQMTEPAKCENSPKIVISIVYCELALDCSSVEAGCTKGVSGSVKRDFVKNETTIFVGVGGDVDAGTVAAGGKAGVYVTIPDSGTGFDAGAKVETQVIGKAGLSGAGVNTETTMSIFSAPKIQVTPVVVPLIIPD